MENVFIYMVYQHAHTVIKDCGLRNDIMKHLHSLCGKNSQPACTTIHVGTLSVRDSTVHYMICSKHYFNQKHYRPLHLSTIAFAYNVMPHNTTGSQPYEFVWQKKLQLLIMLS